jgi:hypothetical protein
LLLYNAKEKEGIKERQNGITTKWYSIKATGVTTNNITVPRRFSPLLKSG